MATFAFNQSWLGYFRKFIQFKHQIIIIIIIIIIMPR